MPDMTQPATPKKFRLNRQSLLKKMERVAADPKLSPALRKRARKLLALNKKLERSRSKAQPGRAP